MLKVEHVSVIVSDTFTAGGFIKVSGHGFSENMKERQYQQKCKEQSTKQPVLVNYDNTVSLSIHVFLFFL